MVSQSIQNYSSLKKSTWPHLLLVGQLGQIGSNLVKLVKTCIIWCGLLQPTPLKENFVHEIHTCVMEKVRVLVPHLVLPFPCRLLD